MQSLLVALIRFAVSLLRTIGMPVPQSVTEALDAYAALDEAADAAQLSLDAAAQATFDAINAEEAASAHRDATAEAKAQGWDTLVAAIKAGFGD